MKALALLFAFLTSCGADSGDGAAKPKRSMLVADAAALPTCDAKGEGWLVYVQAETAFKACQSGQWAPVDIKGEKGEAGKDGNDNRIVKTILCHDTLETGGPYVNYHASVLSSGDVFAQASISMTPLELGSSRFYSGQQVGAETGDVSFAFDVVEADNGGFWNIKADRSTKILTAEYRDADQGEATATYTSTADKCDVKDFQPPTPGS